MCHSVWDTAAPASVELECSPQSPPHRTGRKEARAHGDSVKFSHTRRTLTAGTNRRGREKVREK